MIGLPEKVWGGRMRVVVLKRGVAIGLGKVKSYCGIKLASFKQPRHLVVMELGPPLSGSFDRIVAFAGEARFTPWSG